MKKLNNNALKYSIIAVLVVAIIICGIIFIPKITNKGSFSTTKYYECVPTTNLAGPMTYYVMFDTNGKYVKVLTMPKTVYAGTYKIENNKIIYNQEYFKSANNKVKETEGKYEYDYENGIIKTDSYKCTKTTKKEYDKWAESAGATSYNEMKKEATK